MASHDLELRGAGDLLGADQSGKVNDVGLDLYMEMLEQEILKLKGEEKDVDAIDPEISLKTSAFINPGYIEKESQRLSFYKRLFSVKSEEEVDEIENELLDRFGKGPDEAMILIKVARLKLLLRRAQIISFTELQINRYEIKFSGLTEGDIRQIHQLCDQKPENFLLNPDYSMILSTDLSSKAGYPEQLDSVNSLVRRFRKKDHA